MVASARSKLLSALAMLVLASAQTVLAADEDYQTSDPGAANYKRPIAGYVPTIAPAVIFAGLFGILTVVSSIQFVRHRDLLILPIGLAAMTAGLAVRVVVHSNLFSILLYSISMLLILLSPCAFLACCYQLLGKMANALGPDTVAVNCLLLRASLITKIFVMCDVVTFIIQAGGSGMQAAGGNMAKYGHYIALVGLIVQLISFGFYVCVLVVFAVRVRSKYPELWWHSDGLFSWAPQPFARGEVDCWKVVLYTTLWACLGLMVRCVFRCIEYSQGFDGALATDEKFAYIFDSVPCLLATGAYCYFPPKRFLPRGDETIEGRRSHKLGPVAYTRTHSYEEEM